MLRKGAHAECRQKPLHFAAGIADAPGTLEPGQSAPLIRSPCGPSCGLPIPSGKRLNAMGPELNALAAMPKGLADTASGLINSRAALPHSISAFHARSIKDGRVHRATPHSKQSKPTRFEVQENWNKSLVQRHEPTRTSYVCCQATSAMRLSLAVIRHMPRSHYCGICVLSVRRHSGA